MEFEDLQKAWKSQHAGRKLTIDAGLLLKEVRRNQQQFRATIFWRDAREIVVAMFLALYFTFRGLGAHDWTLCLVGLSCLGVGLFMVVDRLLQRKRKPATDDSLKGCIETSLHQVNHQIWLLRNVFWWYLLPIALALGVFIFFHAWQAGSAGSSSLIFWLVYSAGCGLLYWGVYWLNQYAVRKRLEPRRQELESLLASLTQAIQ